VAEPLNHSLTSKLARRSLYPLTFGLPKPILSLLQRARPASQDSYGNHHIDHNENLRPERNSTKYLRQDYCYKNPSCSDAQPDPFAQRQLWSLGRSGRSPLGQKMLPWPCIRQNVSSQESSGSLIALLLPIYTAHKHGHENRERDRYKSKAKRSTYFGSDEPEVCQTCASIHRDQLLQLSRASEPGTEIDDAVPAPKKATTIPVPKFIRSGPGKLSSWRVSPST
jgi:hypothetical protein